MDESVCSGGFKNPSVPYRDQSSQSQNISLKKKKEKLVCVTKPLIKERKKSTFLSSANILHFSPSSSSSLSTTVSLYRRSRSTGPRHQPAKRKTQAVSKGLQVIHVKFNFIVTHTNMSKKS